MIRLPKRAALFVAGLAIAGLSVGACGGGQAAGAAAVLGDERVTVSQVSEALTEVNEGRGLPANTANATVVQSNVQRLVRANLVEQGAQRLGVSVPEGALDRELLTLITNAGSQEALDAALLQSDIPPSALAAEVQVSLLLNEIGVALAPEADQEVRNTLVFEYLVALSNELGVSVSTRFGSWDAAQLAVAPIPTDVVSPAAEPTPLAG